METMASPKKTTKKSLVIDENEDSSNDSGEPLKKVTKTWDYGTSSMGKNVIITVNKKLIDDSFVEAFRKNWIAKEGYNNNSTSTVLYNDPFNLSVIQNFLDNNEVIEKLIDEMLDITWSRKIMDLYEFYQSADLSGIDSPYLAEFFEMLKRDLMPLMEKLCDIKLSNVSASCSMYNCGDHLLVHDDLLSDRQIAFVFYLSPWNRVNKWSDDMGGCLEIFSTDSNGLPQFPTVRKINPTNNQFLFFKVGTKSFHQVGEVTSYDYPRLTINGWFHGEKNNAISANRFSVPKIFISPLSNYLVLSNWINEIYLESSTKEDIQKVIEDKSEICLREFFLQSLYEKVTSEMITNKNFRWILKGPANAQCYEVLDLESINGVVKDFFSLFTSKEMFKLLYEYTDLDLYGSNARDPMCSMEVQRWTHASYTILGGSVPCEKDVLDVILYFNPADHVGEFTYLTLEKMEEDCDDSESDSDPVLLTVSPKYNAINIIYPSEGASRFTKYVSKKVKIPNEFVYILVCSYKE